MFYGRSIKTPADPASEFDLFFQLASRVAQGGFPTSVARMLGTSAATLSGSSDSLFAGDVRSLI